MWRFRFTVKPDGHTRGGDESSVVGHMQHWIHLDPSSENYTWWWQWRALDLSLTSKRRFLQIPEEYDLRTCTHLTWNIVMSALAPKWSLVCNFTLRCYVVSSFVFWYSEMKWFTNGWELFTSVTINISDLSCFYAVCHWMLHPSASFAVYIDHC